MSPETTQRGMLDLIPLIHHLAAPNAVPPNLDRPSQPPNSSTARARCHGTSGDGEVMGTSSRTTPILRRAGLTTSRLDYATAGRDEPAIVEAINTESICGETRGAARRGAAGPFVRRFGRTTQLPHARLRVGEGSGRYESSTPGHALSFGRGLRTRNFSMAGDANGRSRGSC